MTDTIIVKAPAGTKARWVRQAQREGKKLSDWITQRIEASMTRQTTPILIPAGLQFADLHMTRDPATGDVSFDTEVVTAICRASGLPDDYFLARPEDDLAGLLTAWYRQHLAAGGAPDPVYADLIGEVELEDRHGHGMSHQPGRA